MLFHNSCCRLFIPCFLTETTETNDGDENNNASAKDSNIYIFAVTPIAGGVNLVIVKVKKKNEQNSLKGIDSTKVKQEEKNN